MRHGPCRHPGHDDEEGPLPLEPHEDDHVAHRPPRPASGDETCPNCGQPREDPHALVCMHCGYDMKTLKVIRTKEGVVEEPEEEEEAPGPPLAQGLGPRWLPWVILVPSALVMVIAYLAGARGLFHLEVAEGQAPPPIDFGMRIAGLGRFLVQAGLLTACGFAALAVLAWMLGRKLGDLRQAALRVLALFVALRVVSIIDLQWRSAEWLLETLLEAGAFVGLAFLLFGLRPREVVTWGLLVIAALASFWAASWLGMWSMGG